VTLLSLLVPTPTSQQPVAMVQPTKQKRRRWGRRRPSKVERLAAAQKLDEELRAKRQAWARSLTPPQDELLGHFLEPGVEAVGQEREGQGR